MFEIFLRKLGEVALSKVLDHTTDNAINSAKNIKDFKLILKTLEYKLNVLRAKAFDVEEEIKIAERSGRKKRKREVEEWLEQVKIFENKVDKLGSQTESEELIMRLMAGDKAAKLIAKIDRLVEQRRDFGELVLDVGGTSGSGESFLTNGLDGEAFEEYVERTIRRILQERNIKPNEQVDMLVEQSPDFGELVVDDSGSRGETLLTNGMVGEAFNENLERTLEILGSREVSSIGIYGMGGVGKTTLAKHIHNRLLREQSQGGVFWITVSQEFTIKSLQDKIARLLGVNLSDEDDGDTRAAILHTALSQYKNAVLILDDVWENIDMLKVGFPVSVECCKLIITTRSLNVCYHIGCQKIIAVETLCKDDAWRLFNETMGNKIKPGSEVEEIAKSVVKLCGGLPIGILTIAGSMRGETDIRAWRNALAELKEYVMGQDGESEVDQVFNMLKHSFDRLNRNHQSRSNEFNTLQLCFLYCSLYPEDYEIVRENLVRKFISEGLVDGRKSRRAQVEQGHSILNKLVKVCLLESFVDNIGRECVKMHDLVRCMAMKIGEGKYMVRERGYSLMEIPDEEEWTNDLEKVSLMMSGIRRIGDGISPNCPNLSTLLLSHNLNLSLIPDLFFSKMQGLCTLDLSYTGIRVLPDSLCDIKSLKALLLERCRHLVKVPYLGGLKALRELNLSDTAIKEVPRGVEELINLKFLSMDAPQLEMLPSGLLLKLRLLQHVNFPLHIQVPAEEIENMMQLREFHGGVRNVTDFNWLVTNRVLDTYRIRVGSRDTILRLTRKGGFGYSYSNDLSLCGCNLQDEEVSGQGAVYLTISECEGLSACFVDNLSRLNYPTSLKSLRVSRCGGIEWIVRRLPSQFSTTLETIELVGLGDFKGVIQKGSIRIAIAPGQPVFSSLTRLVIRKCSKSRKLGIPASGVPNIEDIHISESGGIEEIFEDEGRSSLALSRLEKLSLYELPRLKSVCKATMICNSIKRICISACPRLMKQLPVRVDDHPQATLRSIKVEREWWQSLEWDNPDLPQRLQPFLHFF